jgi:hypothetical protein
LIHIIRGLHELRGVSWQVRPPGCSVAGRYVLAHIVLEIGSTLLCNSSQPGRLKTFRAEAPSGVICSSLEEPVRETFTFALAAIGFVAFSSSALSAEPRPMRDDARVYIIWPSDGQVIPGGKFWVRMGLSNAGIAPAGIEKPNTGHHHILVNTELPPMDEEIPNDKNHLHFGAGQTEARLELPPGRHTLQLILGDEHHIPHNPPLYSKKITIIVTE